MGRGRILKTLDRTYVNGIPIAASETVPATLKRSGRVVRPHLSGQKSRNSLLSLLYLFHWATDETLQGSAIE